MKKEGSGYTIISAEDPSGIAAFIGLGRQDSSILLIREKEEHRVTKDGLFFFSIGGRNA
jgi:hypothetical protein